MAEHGLKAKTIKGVLQRKFTDFVDSIDDERVKELVRDGTVITGGSIASMLLSEPVNDFDMYFRDKATAVAVAEYYVEKFKANPPPRFKGGGNVKIFVKVADDGKTTKQVLKPGTGIGDVPEDYEEREVVVPGRVRIYIKSVGIAGEKGDDGKYKYFEGDRDPDAADATEYVEQALSVAQDIEEEDEDKPKYRPIFLTSNAITLSNKVQLIIRFYGDPQEIHENYDFVHCTSYWTSRDGKLVLRPEALECLLAKELRYNGSRYPVCSVFRVRKFINRGWSINAGQLLKMMMQVSHLDLEDIEVLEDQLIGVDAAYFTEIIEKLRQRFEDGRVPSAYLLEIIDRMF